MGEILEVAMIVCFGISWPINIHKLYRTKSTKGVSISFYLLIFVGYIFGLASKVVKAVGGTASPWYVWFFYSLNAVMVGTGILLYFHYLKAEKHQAT